MILFVKVFLEFRHLCVKLLLDLMHDDVTRLERQYGNCSHAQIEDGGGGGGGGGNSKNT